MVSAVGCGVVAGVLLAFSISVMPALRARPEHDGIGTMQQINLAIVAPVFLTVFFGSATASVIASIAAFASDNTSTMFPLVGAVTHLVGCVAVTIRVNVPLNNALAAVDPATAEARDVVRDVLPRGLISILGRRLAVAGPNLLFELRDESVGVGKGWVSGAFVHRRVPTSAKRSELCFEFMVVEYSWIHHSYILRPPRVNVLGFRESVDR